MLHGCNKDLNSGGNIQKRERQTPDVLLKRRAALERKQEAGRTTGKGSRNYGTEIPDYEGIS